MLGLWSLEIMNLVGLILDEAKARLKEGGVDDEKIIVRETKPPRAEKATGAWRVLRCEMSENGACEIVAAREQVVESN